MALRDWWQSFNSWRIKRYLNTYQDLTLNVMRQNHDIVLGALDSLSAAPGDPSRQTLPYPSMGQLSQGGRTPLSTSLPKNTPYSLRRFSEYPPARRAINAICNPILELEWAVEPIPDPDASVHDENTPTSDQHRRIQIASRILEFPNNDDSRRVLLEQVLEDLVIGGYGAIEMVESGEYDRPIWLFPVDGQSIRVNLEWQKHQEQPRYTQALGYSGLSVGTQEGVTLMDDELIYIRLNPRTNTPFGFGYLETAFGTVNAYIGAFEYAERRASNTTPNYALFLGENATDDVVARFRFYWENLIEGFGKVPIFGGGRAPQVLPFNQNGASDPLWLQWQEFLIRVIAMSFGLSPMKLGLERDVNRNTAQELSADDWESVAPVANTYADYINHKLLWKKLGWTDLRFKWIVRDTDEKRQAEILELQYNMNAVTVDEIRQTYKRPPLPAEQGGNLTKSGFEAKATTDNAPEPLPEFGGPPPQEERGAFASADAFLDAPAPAGVSTDMLLDRAYELFEKSTNGNAAHRNGFHA